MDDLAGFLRTRRSRVDPAAVGIPTDSRRRVEGLRREEVAHLSGVSVDYYVRLEHGRATQPSEQVLDALARVLGLDATARGHLDRLARQRHHRAKAPGGRVRPELLRVLDLVADAPALITNHQLDVLAGNRLAELLFGRRIPGLNTALHIFLEEAERGLYADWEKCTLDVVGHLRLAAGKHPGDPGWPRSSANCRWAATASAACGPARTCAPAHTGARRTSTRWSDCWNCTRRISRYWTNQAWSYWYCPQPPAAAPRTGCACSPA